jgi:hypothetical protein
MKIYLLVLIVSAGVDSMPKLSIVNKENYLKKIFETDQDLTFATSTTFASCDFIFEIPNPKLLRNYKIERTQRVNDRNYNYVIVDDDFVHFQNTISSLLKEDNLKVAGKYLIRVGNLGEIEMQLVFSSLWKHEVYNVVVENQDQFYTWYPYEKCGEVIVRRTNLSRLFANKIPRKLNCTLRIDWSRSAIFVKDPFDQSDPGVQVLYANQVVESMGASPVYLQDNIDFISKLMTTKRFDFGAAMVEKNVTFALGGFGYFLGEEILNSTVMSTFIGSLEQVLVLPPRRLRPKWKEFFRFHTSTFSLLVLTVLAYALLTRLRTRMTLLDSIVLSFQLFVQLSTPRRPQTPSRRVFLLSMLIFSMLVNSFYLSMLSGVFTRPNYDPELTSIEDFAKSDIPVECHTEYFALLGKFLEPATRKLLQRKLIHTNKRGLEQVFSFLDNADYAIFASTLRLRFVKNGERLETIRVLLGTFRECLD